MADAASIYAFNDERARAEASAWARFSNARNQTEFCTGWLAILCAQIDRVSGAVVLLGPDPNGTYAPAAIWPNPSHDLSHLGAAAQLVLVERRGIVIAADGSATPTRDQRAHVGYPIEVAGVLHGAVMLDIAPGPEASLQRALRLLRWGSAWFVGRFLQLALTDREAHLGRLTLAMDLVATAVQEPRLDQAALAVANEIASRLKCDRVSIGFDAAGSIKVMAISNTAVFDERMSLVRLIGDAMNEVLDLDTALVWPARPDDEHGVLAHAELAREMNDVAVCSAPLLENGHAIGAVTLERASGGKFDDQTIELCKTTASLLGPILSLKRDNERGMLRRLSEGAYENLRVLFGARHPGAKLIALVLAALLAFLASATGTYRVTAKTVVEGAVQRSVVAPFDGHLAQAFVRAGDTVQAGQILCRLDDRDLRLDFARLTAEREQEVRKSRQALAGQDRGEMMVVAAQLEQTEARISLISDKLARATLTAPFDGIVVSGDLNQLLGTPLEQGKLLFQIAPLNAYRVVLEVDERDVTSVEVDQPGELTLSGLPGQRLDFAVQQITSVASQQEGRNFFRVEAHLTTPTDRMRPGMEGVGKIVVGSRKLLWIWTHSLVDWVRFWIWRALP